MASRLRAHLPLATALVGLVAVETGALLTGTAAPILLGGLVALLAVVLLARADVGRLGVYAAYASAFTLTWNGWYVGPFRPGDLLVLLSFGLLVAADPRRAYTTPPWWVKQLVLALLVIWLTTALFPVDREYIVSRVVVDALGKPTETLGGDYNAVSSTISVAVRFAVGVLVLPLSYTAATRIDPRAVKRLAVAFAVGTSLSGAVAFSDHFGTSLGKILTGIPNLTDRQLGFAYHPNFLATGLVLATPFACWLLVSPVRREQLAGAACLLALFGGMYASGSRGGSATIVVTVIVSFLLLKRTRAHTPAIVLVCLAGAGVSFVAFPAFTTKVLQVTRLVGASSTEGSDTVRSLVAEQGVRDFLHSPIYGIGLHVSTEASMVYLQELASGGLILLLAMTLYNAGAVVSAWRLFPESELAPAIVASVVGALVVNVFEANLSDRYYYVPQAILVALMVASRRAAPDAGADAQPDAAPDVVPTVPPHPGGRPAEVRPLTTGARA